MDEEILALEKVCSSLHTGPEMRFLARAQYVSDKEKYDSNVTRYSDYKANFSIVYRYILDLIRLSMEYDQLTESRMKQEGCAPFFKIIPQLLEVAKTKILELGISFRFNSPEEFEQTLQILESERKALPASKELEESLVMLKYNIFAIELQELDSEHPEDKARKIALLKEYSELPVPREYRFVSKAVYIVFMQEYDLKNLASDDLKGQFIHRYRCVKELKELMLEYQVVKDIPAIDNEYSDLIFGLVSLYEINKEELFSYNKEYITKKTLEYFQTIVALPEFHDLMFQVATGQL